MAKQIEYQGHARATSFSENQTKLSNAEITRMQQNAQRVIRGMERSANADIENRIAHLNATKAAQSSESQDRENIYQFEKGQRKKHQDAKSRIHNTELLSLKTESQNIANQATADQRMWNDISKFSVAAGEIAEQLEQKRYDEQLGEEYNRTMIHGVPVQEQLAQIKGEHRLNIAGECIDLSCDILQAQGADPGAVSAARKLNKAQRHGKQKALAHRAGTQWQAWAQQQLRTNTNLKITIPDGMGGFKEISPSDAATAPEKAAVLQAMLPLYLKSAGVYGAKPAFLNDALFNIRKGNEAILAETRALEYKQSGQMAVQDSLDNVYDIKSKDAVQQYINTYKRMGGREGDPTTAYEALAAGMKNIFTARQPDGTFIFNDIELNDLIAQSYDPLQPNKSTADRFSPLITQLWDERKNEYVRSFEREESVRAVEEGQWQNDAEGFLQSDRWQGDEETVKGLIEAAKEKGFYSAAQGLSKFLQETTDSKNDKAVEEAWTELDNQGMLTEEDVSQAIVSNELKSKWFAKLKKEPPITEEMYKLGVKTINAMLASRARVNPMQTVSTDATVIRAKAYAEAQYKRDLKLGMQQYKGDMAEANKYALGRFQAEFSEEGGKYTYDPIDAASGAFQSFTIDPTKPIRFPFTALKEALRADPGAIEKPLPGISKGSLENVLKTLNARGTVGKMPPGVAYAASLSPEWNAIDVLNAQLKANDLEQIPNDLSGRVTKLYSKVDPVYQSLINYKPSPVRWSIAMQGSGQLPTVIRTGEQGMMDVAQHAQAVGFQGEDLITMTAIAMAESSNNPNITNFSGADQSYGLWQINMIGNMGPNRLKQFGISKNEQLLDPAINARAMRMIFDSQGLGAWGAYTNGSYQNFMGQAAVAVQSLNNRIGSGPWGIQGSIQPGPWTIVEHLTGQIGHPNYDPAHGGDNYHEHFGFNSKASRDAAIKRVEAAGLGKYITSIDREGDPGHHGNETGLDLGAGWGIPDEKLTAWSRNIRRVVGGRGYNG